MARGLQVWAYYVAFVAFVTLALWLAPPRMDPFPFDYGSMAASYSGLLAGLGGFAITVLAVMLGLDALDSQRSSKSHVAAHGVVLRHVSLSLAVASVICFIGALILSEVSVQAISVSQARTQARAEIEMHLNAMALSQAQVAERMLELQDESPKFFEQPGRVGRLVQGLSKTLGLSEEPALKRLKSRSETLDQVVVASARRHLMISSVVALLSSLLILKSITFLLVVRFPSFPAIGGVQDFVVLAFGGMLLIKLLHLASYGLPLEQIATGRWFIAGTLAAVIVAYRSILNRQVYALRKSVVQGELGRYTPAAPYLLALFVCFVTMVYLAATFSDLGPPSMVDRVLVAITALIGSAMIVTIQIERPTLRLFVEADRFGEHSSGGDEAKKTPV